MAGSNPGSPWPAEEGDNLSEQKRKLKTSVKDPLGRGGGLSNFAYAMLSVAGVLSFFLIWQLLIEFGIVSGRYLSKPTEIVALFIYKMTNTNPDGSTIPVSTLASLEVAIVGLLLAIVTGVPIGLLMGWYKGFRKFIKPVFEILRPIPPISWIPLTILWLGIGIKAKAFIIFFAAFIPCVINSATGIEQTNKTLINVAKTCGASNVEIFFKVGIPSALPIMFAGIRVAVCVLILNSIVKLWKKSVADKLTLGVFIAVFLGSVLLSHVSPVMFIVAAAVLGIIAAILGLTGKKAAMTVGIISLIAALAALVYGYAATVSFTGHTVQAAGAIVLAVAAVLMVYGAAAAKKAPVTAQ